MHFSYKGLNMDTKKRFECALERLKSSDWARFEELASEFLASEFTKLRTTASPSGDGGRDSELFSPEGSPKILFQYSVSKDWDTKIKKTVSRISTAFPEAGYLIYVTNQVIGASADKLKKLIREKNGLILDIFDRSWFVERTMSNDQRISIAEKLAKEFVDPLLNDAAVINSYGQALTDTESRAAHLYLTLQFEDEKKDKGLTKVSFQALVRSVLRKTNAEHRMKREDIKQEVRKLLPSHPPEKVDQYTDNALRKMTKHYIRHWQGVDEFCLTYEEQKRLSEMLAKHEREHLVLNNSIKELLKKNLNADFALTDDKLDVTAARVQRILEKYFNSRGEKFALAVHVGKSPTLALDDLNRIILEDFSDYPALKATFPNEYELINNTITDLLCNPSEDVSNFLRLISDAYTLMAFLRETPDVQASIKKLFSHGEVWLDTSILLFLFAERLFEEESKQRYTNMIRAAQKAGLKLSITRGIVEEVHHHIIRSYACYRTHHGEWRGPTPFLFSAYIASGRAIGDFPNWIEEFMGSVRPEEDIVEYINEYFQIRIESLELVAEKVESELRIAVHEIYISSHEWRREKKGYAPDASIVNTLASHDIENYLGIIAKRKAELNPHPLGHSYWWLTLDSTAYRLESLLIPRINIPIPPSPVMSLDFLANYLTFGPLRVAQNDYKLPIFIDLSFASYIPIELLEVANETRRSSAGLPEHVIRRRVRDALDAAKKNIGKQTEAGAEAIQKKIEDTLLGIDIEE